MQVTDESVSVAIDAARKHARDVMGVACEIEPETMRAALEAALGALEATKGSGSKIVELLRAGHPYSGMTDDVDLQAAACIEDLAEALKDMTKTQAEWEESVSQIIGRPVMPFERAIDRARATLERWGLK